MLKRLTVIIAVLTIAGPAFAEPPKAVVAPASKTQPPAEIVLASADVVRSPAAPNAQPAQAPAKRRIARVTSCRCGDPQAASEQQEQ
jgi:hypothetical protein